MDFLALPEEQVQLLLRVHRRRPLQIVAHLRRAQPSYWLVPMEEATLLGALQHPAREQEFRVRLLIRELQAPGELVWAPSEDEDRGPLQVEKSGCLTLWASIQLDGKLVAGSLEYPTQEQFWYCGLTADEPQRLYKALSRQLRILCPHWATDEETKDEIEQGEIPESLASRYVTRVSTGAVGFLETGGRWVTPMLGAQGYEYQLLAQR